MRCLFVLKFVRFIYRVRSIICCGVIIGLLNQTFNAPAVLFDGEDKVTDPTSVWIFMCIPEPMSIASPLKLLYKVSHSSSICLNRLSISSSNRGVLLSVIHDIGSGCLTKNYTIMKYWPYGQKKLCSYRSSL